MQANSYALLLRSDVAVQGLRWMSGYSCVLHVVSLQVRWMSGYSCVLHVVSLQVRWMSGYSLHVVSFYFRLFIM